MTANGTDQTDQAFHCGAWELHGITGVAVARGGDCIGLRVACPHLALGLYDDKDAILAITPPFQRAPDGSHQRFSWRVPLTAAAVRRIAARPRVGGNYPIPFDFAPGEAATITLDWAETGPGKVVARWTTDLPVRIQLLANGSFAPAAISGLTASGATLAQGGLQCGLALAGAVVAHTTAAERLDIERLAAGRPHQQGDRHAVWTVDLAPGRPLYAVLAQSTGTATAAAPDAAAIDTLLTTGAAAYATSRMTAAGGLQGAAEAVADLTAYARTWDPRRQRLQMTVNRTWGGSNAPGLVFGWDNVFMAYQAAYEDPALAAAALEHILAVYGENGIGRGPTQRNLVIPLAVCRTLDVLGDEALARRCAPVLLAFVRFWFADRGDGKAWRDPNGDGLIEPGTNHPAAHTQPAHLVSDAMDETGYDDLPTYSAGFTDGRRGLLADGVSFDWDSQCLDVTLVCQNALYVPACRAVATLLARLGGHEADVGWLESEAARVAARMQERLYDPQRGWFQDRLADGRFSPVTTMRVFYPLLLGTADAATRERLRALLTDPAKFWGGNLVPTVALDEPESHDGVDGNGNYWRGNCWAPTTWIVLQAVRAAGWDDLAAEMAARMHRQFMGPWTAWGHAYENQPPRGEAFEFPYPPMWGGREVRYVWAALLPLGALEEVYGPEIEGGAWRAGNPHLAEETTWSGLRCAGERLTATAGPERTRVAAESWELDASPAIAVRAWRRDAHGWTCRITAPRGATLRLRDQRWRNGIAVHLDGKPLTLRVDGEMYVCDLPAGGGALAITALGRAEQMRG